MDPISSRIETWIAPAALYVAISALAGCGSAVSPAPDAGSVADASADVPTMVDAQRTDVTTIPDAASPDVPPTQDATPIPGHCWQYDPTQMITPAVLIQGQTFGLTADARVNALSCGATPMLDGRPDQLSWTLTACGGCEACDCVDPGYEGSAEVTGVAAGSYDVRVGSTTRPLLVVSGDQCLAINTPPDAITNVEIVGPDLALRHTGPLLWWAHVTGTESRCCGAPEIAAVVHQIRPTNADLGAGLMECNPDPCDCAGSPHAFEAWIDLGELTPGSHGLVVAGYAPGVVAFNVPAMH